MSSDGPKERQRSAQVETRKQRRAGQRRAGQRETRRQVEEAARRRQRRWRWIWWGGGGATVLAVIVALIVANQANAAPTINGIQCQTNEGAATHIHQHLVIYNRGRPVPVAANIGIDATRGCLYWLHTHSTDGVIHVESPTGDIYTLGHLFDIWGQPLSRTQVTSLKTDKAHSIRAYVNGRLYRGDPRAIPLTAHALITLEYGPPWLPPPPFTFQNGE